MTEKRIVEGERLRIEVTGDAGGLYPPAREALRDAFNTGKELEAFGGRWLVIEFGAEPTRPIHYVLIFAGPITRNAP